MGRGGAPACQTAPWVCLPGRPRACARKRGTSEEPAVGSGFKTGAPRSVQDAGLSARLSPCPPCRLRWQRVRVPRATARGNPQPGGIPRASTADVSVGPGAGDAVGVAPGPSRGPCVAGPQQTPPNAGVAGGALSESPCPRPARWASAYDKQVRAKPTFSDSRSESATAEEDSSGWLRSTGPGAQEVLRAFASPHHPPARPSRAHQSPEQSSARTPLSP